jgi:hypothetical protein
VFGIDEFPSQQKYDVWEPHQARSARIECAALVFGALEHDPEKWKPVFRKDHAQSKRCDHNAIPFNCMVI